MVQAEVLRFNMTPDAAQIGRLVRLVTGRNRNLERAGIHAYRAANGSFIAFVKASNRLNGLYAETLIRAHQYRGLVNMMCADGRAVDPTGRVIRSTLRGLRESVQPKQLIPLPPFSDSHSADAFRPLAATVLRRNGLLDLVVDESIHGDQWENSRIPDWSLQLIAQLLSGSIRIPDCLIEVIEESDQLELASPDGAHQGSQERDSREDLLLFFGAFTAETLWRSGAVCHGNGIKNSGNG